MRTEVLQVERVVTPGGVVPNAAVHVADGAIVGIGPADGPVRPGTLVPGFVDLQVNGIGAHHVATTALADWTALDAALLDQGTTTWCPTLVSQPLAHYAAPLATIAAAAARPGRHPTVAGVHLEGPFLAVAGAHPPEVLGPPDRDWLDQLPDIVRLVTLAPELPGALDAVEALARRGVLVAIGHSQADPELVAEAVRRGARLVTHLFNAMTGIHHRAPGTAGAALLQDDLAVSLIADAIHVHPLVLDLVRRAAGPQRCVLVTDQVAGGPTGRPEGQPSAPVTPAGVLAGSHLRMDDAVATAVRAAGFGLAEAVHAASTLPARLLGLDDRGAIEPGRRADLVLLDGDLRATRTWLAEDWR